MALDVSNDRFRAEDELAAFQARCGPNIGAIASFTGLVRTDSPSLQGLFLEHYEGFTQKTIADFQSGIERDLGLEHSRIRHRVGMMLPGEAIVFVATAAPHRKAALEGLDCLMDHLKSAAPFWKKEIRRDGHVWIEPTANDHDQLSRWEESRARNQ